MLHMLGVRLIRLERVPALQFALGLVSADVFRLAPLGLGYVGHILARLVLGAFDMGATAIVPFIAAPKSEGNYMLIYPSLSRADLPVTDAALALAFKEQLDALGG